MRQMLELTGRPASDGIFAGPLAHVGVLTRKRVQTGSPEGEIFALREAVAISLAELFALIEKAEGEAGDILGFQSAMLEDDSLQSSALAAIAAGEAADIAWQAALDAEIAGYEQSEDEYFRARSADLKDIRDRVLRHLSGAEESSGRSGTILVAEDLAPSMFLEADWSKGGAIVLSAGSPTSHVAMLARARGIPMIVGLGRADFAGHGVAIVDGGQGLILLSPSSDRQREYAVRLETLKSQRQREQQFLIGPARRKDGRQIEVAINVAGVDELETIDVKTCDGIGLMRSEFLFRDGAPLPDEDEQYEAYRRFLNWADGKPVTIRTLDIGGDKPIAGLTQPGEKNPFLGLRGIRLTLARPDVFKIQLRAMARAAVHGHLKVMIPMVTVPAEIAETDRLLDLCMDELMGEGKHCKRPPLGIMVEVPAVAVAPELFRQAAFFSIGSNDLTQYVTASSRDEPSVAALNDPSHPAVRRLIASVAKFGRENNIPVSLCGDMASDPVHLATLLAAGITSLSVAPARLGRIKAAIADI